MVTNTSRLNYFTHRAGCNDTHDINIAVKQACFRHKEGVKLF